MSRLWLALKSRLVFLAGNGIESILYDRPDIMYISLHRYGDTLLCVTLWTGIQSCSLPTIRATRFIPIVWLCSSRECQSQCGLFVVGRHRVHLHRGNGFYPGTGDITDSGRGGGTGFNLNIPWQRGNLTDADYAAAFDLVSSAYWHILWSLGSMACVRSRFQDVFFITWGPTIGALQVALQA